VGYWSCVWRRSGPSWRHGRCPAPGMATSSSRPVSMIGGPSPGLRRMRSDIERAENRLRPSPKRVCGNSCSGRRSESRFAVHHQRARRGAAVKSGCRPPPEAARSGLRARRNTHQVGASLPIDHGSFRGLLAAATWRRGGRHPYVPTRRAQ
jgi:hypothetical protein